jgi:hypothetical protein
MGDTMKDKQNGNETPERLGVHRGTIGFSRYDLQLREAYVKELLDLEARGGSSVAQAVDDAIRKYFAARERDMIHSLSRFGC